MKVDLIRYTIAPDELSGEAAALCYNGKNPEKSLDVALDGGHESVIEHAVFTFKIEGVSRVTLAQLTRHRLASFSVSSQRYIKIIDADFVTPQTIIDHAWQDNYKAEIMRAGLPGVRWTALTGLSTSNGAIRITKGAGICANSLKP